MHPLKRWRPDGPSLQWKDGSTKTLQEEKDPKKRRNEPWHHLFAAPPFAIMLIDLPLTLGTWHFLLYIKGTGGAE